MKKTGFIVSTLFALSVTGFGQIALSAPGIQTVNASAEIAQIVGIAQTTALDFGLFSVTDPTTEFTLTIAAAATPSSTPANMTQISDPASGLVTISGAKNSTVRITLTDSDLIYGPNTIALTPTTSLTDNKLSLGIEGSGTFRVGGQIKGTNLPSGRYTGTITVSADYV